MIAVEKLKTELSVQYSRKDFQAAKTNTKFNEFLLENELTATFSEVTILLEICLTTPVTSAESE